VARWSGGTEAETKKRPIGEMPRAQLVELLFVNYAVSKRFRQAPFREAARTSGLLSRTFLSDA
jgi:hypothetical protein